MANWLKKFLEKLAKENKDAFNGQKLDCCDLNRSSQAQTSKGSKK